MKESTLCRAYTVKENSSYGRTLTIRESPQPETRISREDWYALMRITREYCGDFTWQPEPAPSNLKPEPTID